MPPFGKFAAPAAWIRVRQWAFVKETDSLTIHSAQSVSCLLQWFLHKPYRRPTVQYLCNTCWRTGNYDKGFLDKHLEQAYWTDSVKIKSETSMFFSGRTHPFNVFELRNKGHHFIQLDFFCLCICFLLHNCLSTQQSGRMTCQLKFKRRMVNLILWLPLETDVLTPQSPWPLVTG